MAQRRTILERRWPSTPEFSRLAADWSTKASTVLLGYLWQGCDSLLKEVLDPIGGANNGDKSLERSLNSKIVPRVQKAMPGDSPFYFQHKPDEMESLASPSAQPPEPDMGFILWANERLMWPIEAKILRTDGSVGEYVAEIRGNYLRCRYAPFSSEGGMLGYLLSGSPDTAFENIGRGLRCKLKRHTGFRGRNQRLSGHCRSVPRGKKYPRNFKCHHMLLEVGGRESGGDDPGEEPAMAPER